MLYVLAYNDRPGGRNWSLYGGDTYTELGREVHADFNGHVVESLAKAADQRHLDDAVNREGREVLLEAMREWGALDKNYAYKKSLPVNERRGYVHARVMAGS